LGFALVTFHGATKHSVAACGAYIAGFFVFNPFFSAELSSVWDSSENNLLAHGHGEVVDMVTGKFITLMTPCVSFLFRAVPDVTLATMHERFIGQAATAPNVFY
jgi:hypothetical protein